MKIKKVVSAISALTMVVSAFAGMTVAKAAEYSLDQVLYGVNTDGTITAQTDFTGDNAASDISKVYAGTTFMDGTALAANKGTSVYFKDAEGNNEAVSTGKVRFAASYTVLGGVTNAIKLVDSDGNMVVGLYPKDSKNSGTINNIQIGTTETGSSYVYTPRSVAYNVDITINFDSKTYAYSLTACTGGSSGTVNKIGTSSGEGDLSGVSNIAGLVTASNKNAYYMDNIMLYNEKSTSTLYGYTVNYTLDGATVRTDSASASEGTVITADKYFTENGTKYFVIADETPTVTVSSTDSNELNVPVRVANNYTYSVNAVGDVTKSIIGNTNVVEGETFDYAYPQFIVENGVAYESSISNSSDGKGYANSVVNVSKNGNVTISYTKKYENVVLFDDLDGGSAESASSRASNGLAHSNAEYTSSVKLQPGTYTFVIRYQNKGRGSVIAVGDQTVFTYADKHKNSWNNATVEVEIEEAAPVTLLAGGSKTFDCLDTILVYGTPKTPATAAYSCEKEYTGASDAASLFKLMLHRVQMLLHQ